MKILAVTEQRDAKWNKVSFEILAAAQQIAEQTKGTISAVVIGKGVAALADEFAGYHLDEVLLVEHDLLQNYTPDGFSIALKRVIESTKPDLVLFPHTYQVRDFAPRLTARFGAALPAEMAALSGSAPLDLRVNSLKADRAEAQAALAAEVRRVWGRPKCLEYFLSNPPVAAFVRTRANLEAYVDFEPLPAFSRTRLREDSAS